MSDKDCKEGYRYYKCVGDASRPLYECYKVLPDVYENTFRVCKSNLFDKDREVLRNILKDNLNVRIL